MFNYQVESTLRQEYTYIYSYNNSMLDRWFCGLPDGFHSAYTQFQASHLHAWLCFQP